MESHSSIGRSRLSPSRREADRVLPTVMTTEEVAALLRVNRKAIYGAVARGELPGAHRVGRKLRFARDAVLAWLVGRGAVAEAQ